MRPGSASVDWPTAADEVGFAVRAVLAAIDQSLERRFVGRCDCGASLFARDERSEVTCPGCGARLDVDAGRAQLVDDVRDTLLTSASIRAALRSWAGVDVKPATVRQWVRRGKLAPLASDVATGHPMFRAGDVLDLTR